MDFLDSLDLDTIDKKSHRVRSWYLYEQYKSLERSQLDAAKKLKDRSYQDRILRQELSERRARRKLYDQFGLCQSESRIKKNIRTGSTKTSVSASNDDFFESFCDLHEDERVTQVTETEFSDDTFSHDDLSASKCCIDDFKSVEDQRDDNSYSESINSVVENLKPDSEGCPPLEEMEFTKNTMAEDINMQLEAVKEDIQCLEKLAILEDVDKSSENSSVNTVEDCESKHVIEDCESKHVMVSEKCEQEYNNNVVAIWSRLVSFAYQVVQLNHGNCYCDYSSQFLTAVLACDVLRRGVNRMCNILQPYVSPIKFATDESDVSRASLKNVKRKKSAQSRKLRKTFENKPLSNKKARSWSKARCSHRNFSETCWNPLCQHSLEKRTVTKKSRRASEPWRSFAKICTSKDSIISQSSSSDSSPWPDSMKEKPSKALQKPCSCCLYRQKAVNPMLKIAHYIDSILKDIDDS